MDIFYIRKNEFLSSVDKAALEKFSDGREYNSQDKKLEHLCGLFLTKFIAKNIYDVNNLGIEICNRKPFFVSREIFFSISHSKDIILVAFNNYDIGVDVEYMRKCNYKAIMSRYNAVDAGEEPAQKDFYKFWTMHEAQIKFGCECRASYSEIIEADYMLSCTSTETLISNFMVSKLICDGKNVDLLQEIEHPQYFKLAQTLH